jgi:hypothetical protein
MLPCPHAATQRKTDMMSVMAAFVEILDFFVCIRAGNDYICGFAFGFTLFREAKIRKNKLYQEIFLYAQTS